MTIAVGYVRVSTSGQAVDGVSLEAQHERIRGWALVHGHDVGSIHVDAGLSGGRADNRPGLQAALEDACRQKGALVVYSLSRLARSTKDAISIGERLAKAGADLVSLTEQIDTTTAAGKMVFRMLAVLAEFERDLVSERTRSALSHLRALGKPVSGTVPFGFDRKGQQLFQNDIEQAALEGIREMRRSGLSYREIGRQLHASGIRPKRGQRWHPKVLRSLIGTVAA